MCESEVCAARPIGITRLNSTAKPCPRCMARAELSDRWRHDPTAIVDPATTVHRVGEERHAGLPLKTNGQKYHWIGWPSLTQIKGPCGW